MTLSQQNYLRALIKWKEQWCLYWIIFCSHIQTFFVGNQHSRFLLRNVRSNGILEHSCSWSWLYYWLYYWIQSNCCGWWVVKWSTVVSRCQRHVCEVSDIMASTILSLTIILYVVLENVFWKQIWFKKMKMVPFQ